MKKNNSTTKTEQHSEIDFVPWFRNAAPYINAFRNQIFVIYFSGDILDDNEFPSLIHDITLLNSLGVKLVLVHGARSQIDKKLKQHGIESQYAHGLRVTNYSTMQLIKEASGCIRIDLEALFSTSLKYTPMAGSQINIISGNYVLAKPKGIIDGVGFFVGTLGGEGIIDITHCYDLSKVTDGLCLQAQGIAPAVPFFVVKQHHFFNVFG